MSQLLRKLVDKLHKLITNSHHHITNVVLPLGEIVHCFRIVKDSLSCSLSYLLEFVHGVYIAFVDILDLLGVYQALQTLVALLLRGVEIEADAVDGAALAQHRRRSLLLHLHHVLDDIQCLGKLFISSQNLN